LTTALASRAAMLAPKQEKPLDDEALLAGFAISAATNPLPV